MNTQDEKAQKDGWIDEAQRQRFLESCRKLSESLKKLAEKLQDKSYGKMRIR